MWTITNHRKVMKTDPNRLISRKLAANLELIAINSTRLEHLAKFSRGRLHSQNRLAKTMTKGLI